MVLKGAALAVVHYADLGLRPMQDVDVLVPTRRAPEAIRVLLASGWKPMEPTLEQLPGVRHSSGLHDSAGGMLDLHWHALYWPAPEADFWGAALPFDMAGVRTRALCPTDELLMVCADGVVSTPFAPARWVADAVTVLRSSGPGIDWQRLVERARARQLTVALQDTLRCLHASFPGTAPEGIVAQLAYTLAKLRAYRRP